MSTRFAAKASNPTLQSGLVGVFDADGDHNSQGPMSTGMLQESRKRKAERPPQGSAGPSAPKRLRAVSPIRSKRKAEDDTPAEPPTSKKFRQTRTSLEESDPNFVPRLDLTAMLARDNTQCARNERILAINRSHGERTRDVPQLSAISDCSPSEQASSSACEDVSVHVVALVSLHPDLALVRHANTIINQVSSTPEDSAGPCTDQISHYPAPANVGSKLQSQDADPNFILATNPQEDVMNGIGSDDNSGLLSQSVNLDDLLDATVALERVDPDDSSMRTSFPEADVMNDNADDSTAVAENDMSTPQIINPTDVHDRVDNLEHFLDGVDLGLCNSSTGENESEQDLDREPSLSLAKSSHLSVEFTCVTPIDDDHEANIAHIGSSPPTCSSAKLSSKLDDDTDVSDADSGCMEDNCKLDDDGTSDGSIDDIGLNLCNSPIDISEPEQGLDQVPSSYLVNSGHLGHGFTHVAPIGDNYEANNAHVPARSPTEHPSMLNDEADTSDDSGRLEDDSNCTCRSDDKPGSCRSDGDSASDGSVGVEDDSNHTYHSDDEPGSCTLDDADDEASVSDDVEDCAWEPMDLEDFIPTTDYDNDLSDMNIDDQDLYQRSYYTRGYIDVEMGSRDDFVGSDSSKDSTSDDEEGHPEWHGIEQSVQSADEILQDNINEIEHILQRDQNDPATVGDIAKIASILQGIKTGLRGNDTIALLPRLDAITDMLVKMQDQPLETNLEPQRINTRQPRPRTAEEVNRFAAAGIRGPTADNFRVDLKVSLSSAWNKCVAVIFRKDFLECGSYYAADPSEIEARFLTHLKCLVKQMQRLDKGGHRSDGEYDSGGEDTFRRFDGSANARQQRRYGLSVRRANVAKAFNDLNGDESEAEGYGIIGIPWRAPDLT
ncbi:hypothetical protein C8R48DRAFT_673984 [Suillus tomentosus]|nr:hypothetical protein C8R48DRAFT_673984 [Suillus tomentosus]